MGSVYGSAEPYATALTFPFCCCFGHPPSGLVPYGPSACSRRLHRTVYYILFQTKTKNRPSRFNIPVEWAFVAKWISFSIAKGREERRAYGQPVRGIPYTVAILGWIVKAVWPQDYAGSLWDHFWILLWSLFWPSDDIRHIRWRFYIGFQLVSFRAIVCTVLSDVIAHLLWPSHSHFEDGKNN